MDPLKEASQQIAEASKRTFENAQGCLSPRPRSDVEANKYRALADAERIRADANADELAHLRQRLDIMRDQLAELEAERDAGEKKRQADLEQVLRAKAEAELKAELKGQQMASQLASERAARKQIEEAARAGGAGGAGGGDAVAATAQLQVHAVPAKTCANFSRYLPFSPFSP